MKKLSNWIISHKITMLIITAVLIVLSIVGSLFVKKNGDVISYLDKNTDTIIGKTMLSDEYGIVGDAQVAFTYLDKNDVSQIVSKIETNSHIKATKCKVVWVGTFDKLDLLTGNDIIGNTAQLSDQDKIDLQRIKDLSAEKFQIKRTVTLEDGSQTEVDVFTVAFYFATAGSDDATIKAITSIQTIIDDYITTKKIATSTYNENTLEIVNSIKKQNSELYNIKYNPSESLDSSDFYYIGGTSENARKLVDSSVNDMPKFMIAAVLAVFVILLISTQSYLEPLIFLATLGLSILFNMGTNLIAGNPIGTISTITSSCSSILQLAISMDFSIFLMHTYYEEMRICMNPEEAMRKALPKTIKSIASSALTTVGGFIALFFMKFGMGYDLGFVLAKGVLLSLLAVMFIQPVLILFCKKPIEKTQHKWRVTPRLKFVTKTITKLPIAIAVVVLCLGIAIPSAIWQTKAPLSYLTVTEANLNPNLAETVIGDENNQLILIVPFDGTQESIDKQFQFIEELKLIGVEDENIYSIIKKEELGEDKYSIFSLFTMLTPDLYNTFTTFSLKDTVEQNLLNNFIAKDDNGNYQYMLYTVNLEGDAEDVQSYNAMLAIRKLANDTFHEIYVTGVSQGAYELSLVTPTDFVLVNILSAVIIFLILLITFKNPLLAAILLLVIETGIFVNLALVTLVGSKIHFMAYLIVSSIELGATVDYAIVLTSKYREEKAHGVKSMQSIKNAIYRAAPGVLTSSAILIAACISVKLLTSNLIVSQITELIARGTFFSLILVFSLLPAMLSLYERTLRYVSIKRGKGDPDEGKTEENLYGPSRKDKKAKLLVSSNSTPTNDASSVNIVLPESMITSTADDSTGLSDITETKKNVTLENSIVDNTSIVEDMN